MKNKIFQSRDLCLRALDTNSVCAKSVRRNERRMKEFEINNENDYLPLRDVVFNTLRTSILTGELKPGERLMEIHLADKLGVSRTPIREAIRKLELEGLVTMIPRRGAEVAQITEKNLRDVLEVRRALEHLACELAIDCASDAELAELGAIIDELGRAETPGEAARIAFRFQHELAFVGGNSILPLIYYSFRSPVITLWERFCSRHSVEALYRNASTLLEHVRNRDKAAVGRWIDQYLNEAIRGSRQIYEG